MTACAPTRAPVTTPTPPAHANDRPVPTTPPADPPAPVASQETVARLYDELSRGQALYLEGIDLLAGGDEVAGEERVATATNAIFAASRECAATTGCEVGRFLAAIEELLNRQSLALKLATSRAGELEAGIEEAEEAEREPGTPPVAEAIPEVGRTAAMLRGTDLESIITLNAPVNAALNDWLTWMRPMLLEAHTNYQFLRPKIAPIYEEAGLPEALLFAMIATETGGKVHSMSRAGAAGILQFMPSTGRRFGLGMQDGFDERLDPAAATRANVAYLNEQFRALNDDLAKALAAYNGGESRMQALERRYGSATSVWDPRVYTSLPVETREYVPRILAAAWLFLHPDRYGLEFPALDATTTRLVLEEDISLDELAICLGHERSADGWFRTLRNLNPRWTPGERLKRGTEIEVPQAIVLAYAPRCIGTETVARARELHEAKYQTPAIRAAAPEMLRYTVRSGDTLAKIASRYGCSVGELARLNGIRPPHYVVRKGQQLRIPRRS